MDAVTGAVQVLADVNPNSCRRQCSMHDNVCVIATEEHGRGGAARKEILASTWRPQPRRLHANQALQHRDTALSSASPPVGHGVRDALGAELLRQAHSPAAPPWCPGEECRPPRPLPVGMSEQVIQLGAYVRNVSHSTCPSGTLEASQHIRLQRCHSTA